MSPECRTAGGGSRPEAAATVGYNRRNNHSRSRSRPIYRPRPSEPVEIYCVKCRAKTASRDIEAVTMKNGRAATRSTCADCGTKKFRIGVLP